jgi:hypothetical protein
LAGVCLAQDATTSDQETIRRLVQQVRELQARVEILEGRPPAVEPVVSPAEKPDDAVISSAMHQLYGIQWRGFGEYNYKALDQRQPELSQFGSVPGSAGQFYTGDFDLLLTSKLNDKTSVLAEIVFGQDDVQHFDIDLERTLLKYDYNDHFKLSVGRFHTGIGYYNMAYHSGKWLTTSVDRPAVMEFSTDGGMLPTHAIGVSLTGLVPSGPLGLNYLFEYGTSRTVRPRLDGSGLEDDEHNGNAVNIGIFARPRDIPGLQIGGSFYHDKITDQVGPSSREGQSIVNVHAVYIAHGIESLNEGFLIRHAIENSTTVFNMPAFYSQISRRFGRLRPFVRYQYANMNSGSILRDILLRHGPSFGFRYDFNDHIAFKSQLDHTIRKGQEDLNGVQLQVAFTF